MYSKLLVNSCVAAGALALASSAQADVLITEFMPNPSGTDAEREWIEIYNAGDSAVDLSNYKIGTSETQFDGEDMNQFPTGSSLGAGEVALIAINAAAFFEWTGIQAQFEIFDTDPNVPELISYPTWWEGESGTGGFAIANSQDQILLLNENDEVVDYTVHGGSYGDFELPQLGTSQSFERIPANVDTDTADDWVLRLDGEATPGVVTVPVPEPTSLAVIGLGGLGLLRRRRA